MANDVVSECFLCSPFNRKTFRELYKKAMTKGYVETSVTKCLILGAAGVGKTHFKHLFLKMDPPQQRVSTGLADNPVRAISSTLAGVREQEEDDLFVIENDQSLVSVIGKVITNGDISMAPSLAKMETYQAAKQHKVVDVGEEMAHHIHLSSENKKLFGVKFIQFTDCGGQLQYHDILPLFIQDPIVTIFALNLSEELSHHPTIEYYGADGRPVSRPYHSSLSHKQILQHCLGAIHSRDTHPMIAIVGTHKDTEERCSESRKEKEQQLQALLDPKHFHVLYNGEEMNEVIFAVNCQSPGNEDKRIASVLKTKILSKCSKKLTKLPLAWFGLEIQLRMSSHDGILSLSECLKSAEKVYIDNKTLFAALHHLVHHNVFLYYPEVLPQTVFCDPQVVITKVNELVEYHHKLRDCPQEGVAVESDLINFRDHGMVSVELLRKFPKHYIEGLFTPQDLIKLLLSRGAIVVIRDDKHLMPALLPHLDPDQVAQYREHGAPLMIRFSQGYIPSGLFCNFIALLFSFSWKVCMDRGKPSCLYRNCIRLEQSGTSNIMTLIDMFSYIEVHVREASCRVRREIRGYVTCGIKSACSVLKYHDVQLEDSFSCCGDCCRSDPPHLTTVVTSRGSEYKWKCTLVGDQMGDLSEDQLIWFLDCPLGAKVISSSLISFSPSATPTIRQLISITIGHLTLIQSVGTRYPDLGILLLEDDNGVLVDSLTSEHQRNAEEITRAILQRWIAGTGRKPTTWMTLADVLRQCQLTVQADAIQACFL
ncbi:hypothetical protein EMCRGX_G014111 [Ephydatia muelleri]